MDPLIQKEHFHSFSSCHIQNLPVYKKTGIQNGCRPDTGMLVVQIPQATEKPQLSYVVSHIKSQRSKSPQTLDTVGVPPTVSKAFGSLGAGNQTRTDDLLITNQLLYRLSYSSIHFHLSRSHRRQGGLDSASTIPHLPPAVKSVSQSRAFFVGRQGGKSSSRLCAPQKTSQPQRSRLQSSPAQMPPVYRIHLPT